MMAVKKQSNIIMIKKVLENHDEGQVSMSDILKRDGLSIELLKKLSYESQLGTNLKRNLHYFDKRLVLEELVKVNKWYDHLEFLHDCALDYRIKSINSAIMKFERYYPNHQARKVFDDLLGFRSLCDNYKDILALEKYSSFRVADMSHGKSNDDGYRGVHIYYQKDNFHYPIEIQYNTYYDRQFNNWLHKYIYKKNYDYEIGCYLRKKYEEGKLTSEENFKEELNYVLSCGERC